MARALSWSSTDACRHCRRPGLCGDRHCHDSLANVELVDLTGSFSAGKGATTATVAAEAATWPAYCQTCDSASSWAGSVQTTKSRCCRFMADGAAQPASSTRSKSALAMGRSAYTRTLRRAMMWAFPKFPLPGR